MMSISVETPNNITLVYSLLIRYVISWDINSESKLWDKSKMMSQSIPCWSMPSVNLARRKTALFWVDTKIDSTTRIFYIGIVMRHKDNHLTNKIEPTEYDIRIL